VRALLARALYAIQRLMQWPIEPLSCGTTAALLHSSALQLEPACKEHWESEALVYGMHDSVLCTAIDIQAVKVYLQAEC
jgi:hypothetical protein